MDPIPHAAERCVRRSRARLKVLLMLSSLGEAYVGQLSRACGLSHTRVKWCLHGRAPYYRPELSLLALGLARERRTPTGRFYEITTKGRRKARSLASAMGRRRRSPPPM